MLNIRDLRIDPASLGAKKLLVDVAPAYEYKDGKRTDTVTGYRYIVALGQYPSVTHFAGGGAYGDSLRFPQHLQRSPFPPRTQHLRRLGQQMKKTEVCVTLGTEWNFLVLFFQTAAI